jgi:hypothetical protein
MMNAVAAFREFFLLEKAQERARRLTGERGARARALHAAATARRQCADELIGAPVLPAAMVLYRDALRLFARARQLDADLDVTEDEAAALEGVRRAIDELGPERREPLQAAFDRLTTADDLAFDRIEEADATRAREQIEDLFRWLEGTVDARTVEKLKVMRVLRLAGVALALLALLRAGVHKLFAPPNVALGKPVTASSRYPGTPDPASLTDGDARALGVHTTVEGSPWVTIDLGKSYAIRTVRVHNRTDCCFDEGLGLTVELGDPDDPNPFVVQQSAHYETWEIDAGGKKSSTVRLRLPRSGYIALSEVEVFVAK